VESSLRTAGSGRIAAGVAADYDKHAQATGVSDGIVKYGAPTRTEIEGDAAYVIVPTTYLYKERGQPTAEEADDFVLHAEAGGWKIRNWTWFRREATPGEVTPFAARPRKRVPHEFVLDALAALSPRTRPMFGCLAFTWRTKLSSSSETRQSR